MNELVVIGKGASYPCFVKQGDIIKEYEIVLDKFRAPRIKVEPHHYMTVNKDNMSMLEFDICGKYDLEQIPIFINIDDVKVIKGNKGERKMKKFKLKSHRYSFDHEGMIINGKLRSCEHEIEVYAGELCDDNIDIMSKMDIRQCMAQGGSFTWGYGLDILEPLDPIKLTNLEYEILKYTQKQGAKYIYRNADGGEINISKNKPSRGGSMWFINGPEKVFLRGYLENLFKFIKWEDEPLLIEDILDNYEIVEDE